MKKLAILMTAMLMITGFAYANPIFESPQTRGQSPLFQVIDNGDCNDTDRRTPPGLERVCEMTWVDPDDDGDGILTLESTELLTATRGDIISSTRAEKPKFKAGAELSKFQNPIGGDLDGDGLTDVLLEIRQEETRNKDRISITGVVYEAPKNFETASKPELVEAIESRAGLSKADSKKALDSMLRQLGIEEPRRR